jgi:type III pantothenate kinase
MDLIIDQGNTRIKIAFFKKDELIQSNSYTSMNAQRLESMLDEFESQKPQFGSFEAGIISSVGITDNEMISMLEKRMHFFELSANLKLPVELAYKTPSTLGNDRIALAAGAAGLFPDTNVLVIDAGTCITYDLVTTHKEYLGGSISPGIDMRFKALHTFASKLPLVSNIKRVDLVGNTTEKSIQSGVINGARAELDGIIQQYNTLYPGIQVILTGGDMFYFDYNSKSNIFAVSNLVLLGLKEILKYNA